MTVDILQLPIPDWGLICPRCRYLLRGLPEHRCPECGLKFDLEQLVQPWTRLRDPRFTGAERPLPDFGLLCPACRRPLAGAPDHACPHCGAPFDPQAWRPPGQWFILDREHCGTLPMLGVMALLSTEQVPFLPVNERSLAEVVLGQHAIMEGVKAPTEFCFEVRWLLRRALLEMQAVRAAANRAEWRCAHCRELNPANFEICWKCEGVRSDSSK